MLKVPELLDNLLRKADGMAQNQSKRQDICAIGGNAGGARIPEPFGTEMIPL